MTDTDSEKVSQVRRLLRNPFPDVNLTSDQRAAVKFATRGYTIREVGEALNVKPSTAAFLITIGAAKVGVKKARLPDALLRAIQEAIG